jgi:hypothetical protein
MYQSWNMCHLCWQFFHFFWPDYRLPMLVCPCEPLWRHIILQRFFMCFTQHALIVGDTLFLSFLRYCILLELDNRDPYKEDDKYEIMVLKYLILSVSSPSWVGVFIGWPRDSRVKYNLTLGYPSYPGMSCTTISLRRLRTLYCRHLITYPHQH